MVDEGSAVSVDQANISALMDALQNAGYHLGTGNQQIIINDDGNAMVVDQQASMTRLIVNMIYIKCHARLVCDHFLFVSL